METDNNPRTTTNTTKVEMKCNVCEKSFENVTILRAHKKAEHLSNGVCQQFLDGECTRGSTCWFKHVIKEPENEASDEENKKSDFQFPGLNPFPPGETQVIMKTLNMVLERMKMMEEMFQQRKD
jgi:hypothetical protein